MSIITINNLSKSFFTEAGKVDVLKGINMNITKGQLIGIYGKSGSGKSTLLNMVTGIDKPDTGEVFIKKEPVHLFKESKMAQWRGHHIGIVFQFFQLLPMLTLLENVMMPMDFCNKYSREDRRKRAMLLLERMEIADQAMKYPTAVSGGQQQRSAIARALANDPDIIIADEPTGNLDSKTANTIFHIFKQQAEEGKTVIIFTHDSSLKNEFSKCYTMVDGEMAG